MKKPNIRNWTKYWAGTFAVSCMLLVGACDNNEQQTADNADLENEIEAAENQVETPAPEQENVASDMEARDMEENEANTQMAEEETENTVNQVEYERTAASPDRSANRMGNMDEHVEEHEQVNDTIRETLTDTEANRRFNQNNSQQGTPNRENMSQEADAYLIIYEQYSRDTEDQEYTQEDRQQMEDIMNEYKLRRERMSGQMDPETRAYASPEVDPQPEMGMEQLMDQIQENVEYPQDAAASETEGTVFVNFIVDEEGNIENAKANPNVYVPAENKKSTAGVLNPTNLTESEVEELKKEMMKEAVKAVEATSGQWEPAMHNGQTVRAEVQLPVVFDIANITNRGDY